MLYLQCDHDVFFFKKRKFFFRISFKVWDASSDAHISFENEKDLSSNLAIIVENNLIQASLTNDLNKFKNLDILYSSQLKDFKQKETTVDLTLKDNTIINTSLLIGSDGANSMIRNNSNLNVMKWDYDQVAIVATLKLAEVIFFFLIFLFLFNFFN